MAYSVRILATNFYTMATEEVFKQRMELIESLVSELNELCKRYVTQKDEFKGIDRIPIVFNAIKDQGIKIVVPQITFSSPEILLLSSKGQLDFEKLITIREILKDVKESDFEMKAHLRDIEKDLVTKIRNDFSIQTTNQYFIFPPKNIEFVIFNDPDGELKTIFKYSDWDKIQ